MTPVIPSATAIILRAKARSPNAFEVLLLRRNTKLVTHGGSWVFPGGKIDPADYTASVSNIDGSGCPEPPSTDERLMLGLRAAIRETREEAGVNIGENALRLFSTWLTPATMSKRFDATFFIALIPGSVEVTVDGSEISEYQWLSPSTALSFQRSGSFTLPPPTFVTLTQLARFDCPFRAMNELCATPVHYRPKLVAIKGGFCSVYEEDAAYHNEQLETSGPRHRLLMLNQRFTYESDY